MPNSVKTRDIGLVEGTEVWRFFRPGVWALDNIVGGTRRGVGERWVVVVKGLVG